MINEIPLRILFTIIGIGASSGLVCSNEDLYVISDNSSFLYHYNKKTQSLNKIPLVDNAKENIPKPEKLDLESICLSNNKIFILGSGSKANRCQMFVYDIKEKYVTVINQIELFERIEKELQIPPDQINIEGFIIHHNKWMLFQRGNGDQEINGIITYNIGNLKLDFKKINLPKIKNVTSSFTDAVLYEDQIYFLASAENSASTYLDGEVMGSLIGRINLNTLEIMDTQIISLHHKFEGLAIHKYQNNQIDFLLCEDKDSEVLESTIYEFSLNIKPSIKAKK